MFLIPHQAIDTLTFPGVIMHNVARRTFAHIAKVPVYTVSYFRFGNPSGYVDYAPTDDLKSMTLITTGPLIVNTILCAVITFPVTYEFYILDTEEKGLVYFLWWIGLSIGIHALPDDGDIEALRTAARNTKEEGTWVSLAKCFAWFFKIVNWLRILWIDVVYAVLVSFALPMLMRVL